MRVEAGVATPLQSTPGWYPETAHKTTGPSQASHHTRCRACR